MKEREASSGTKLCALICAMNTRRTFKTCLNEFEEQANSYWDDFAYNLQKSQIQALKSFGKPQLRLVKNDEDA